MELRDIISIVVNIITCLILVSSLLYSIYIQKKDDIKLKQQINKLELFFKSKLFNDEPKGVEISNYIYDTLQPSYNQHLKVYKTSGIILINIDSFKVNMIKIPMGYHTYEKINEFIKITFQLENKLSFAYLFKDNNVSKADFDNF